MSKLASLALVFPHLLESCGLASPKHSPSPFKSFPLNLTRRLFSEYNKKMGCGSSKPEKQQEDLRKQNHASSDADQYVEGVVCKVSDVNENEMKSFELGEDGSKVLLVKQNGEFRALGAKCTHYGAPLVNGALGDGRIRCQWHGACFNLLTGDIEDFPGLDSLPCFKVTVENNQVKVRAKKQELETSKRTKPMVKKDEKQSSSIVVIGGGPSGATCVETLRQEGFNGSITMICKENYLPYDRVKVSKTMDFEISKAEFRTDEFYKQNDIDVLKGVEATAVDTEIRKVTLSNGQTLDFTKLYIATGSEAIKAPIPGSDLKNVIVLRDYDHAKYTEAQLGEDKEVVVLGASFVALEAANYCVNKVKKVTVIGRDTVPFRQLLGARIGEAVMSLFKSKGVEFIMKSGMKRVLDDGCGCVSGVELIDKTTLKADLCIMGVGSRFYTSFLEGSGVSVLPSGAVEVDEYMQTNVEGVYAGGDIAHAPVWSYGGRKSTIGHYPLAHYHGRIAALNMVGKKTEAKAVPYFWTMLFGKGIRYAGHGRYDDILYHGDVEELKFLAFYLEGDEVVAASSCGMDPYVSKFAEALAQGRKLYRSDLEGDMLAWAK